MDDKVIKLPRLYVDCDLYEGAQVALTADQGHYLRNVLRARAGGGARLFNGRDGEWQGTIGIVDKRDISIRIEMSLREQPPPLPETHLYFAPIKKARMDWLIEKAVEMGVTHLHPVLTQNTEVRAVNAERIRAQIIEAAEQCERMDVPELLPLRPLKEAIPRTGLFACIERMDAESLEKSIPENSAVSFLIGPEGGFSAEEKSFLSAQPGVKPVSLGSRILRSETAAVVVLCAAEMKRNHG